MESFYEQIGEAFGPVTCERRKQILGERRKQILVGYRCNSQAVVDLASVNICLPEAYILRHYIFVLIFWMVAAILLLPQVLLETARIKDETIVAVL